MHARSALWGDAFDPREPGAVALVSQSGNVAVNALAARRGLRFHTVVASGNQAVLSAADYLELLSSEEGVRSIALYLEDDGGPRLCEGLAACAAAGVRVAVLKVGESPAGALAAAAHSGALAGDQRVFRALIEEAGGLWAEDLHELLELSKTLAARSRAPAGRRGRRAAGRGLGRGRRGLAILTCSGGDSAQGADEAARLGSRCRRSHRRRARACASCCRDRDGREPARLHGDDLGRRGGARRARRGRRLGPQDRRGARLLRPATRARRSGRRVVAGGPRWDRSPARHGARRR